MDDNTFDDIIKNKLDNYEDPHFDPSSLDALRERLSGVEIAPQPWYSKNTSRMMIAASLLLFTLVNWYILTKTLNTASESTASSNTNQQQLQQLTVDSLNQLITNLKCSVEQGNSTHQVVVNHEPIIIYREVAQEFMRITEYTDSINGVRYKIHVGDVTNLSEETKNQLTRLKILSVENGEAYVMLNSANARQARESNINDGMKLVALDELHLKQPQFIIVTKNESLTEKSESKKSEGKVSLEAIRSLEKHRFGGIGIEVAPHLDGVKAIFSNGAGGIAPRIGITADWILSPRLSVETGVDYMKISNDLNLNSSENFMSMREGLGPRYGVPSSVLVSSTLGSVPVAFKYRQWLTATNQWVVKIGVTPYAQMNTDTQYNYRDKTNVNPDPNTLNVTTFEKNNDFGYYGSTLTAAIGITGKTEKRKNKFETSLFYERSVQKVDHNNFTIQLVGVRAAYWFKIK